MCKRYNHRWDKINNLPNQHSHNPRHLVDLNSHIERHNGVCQDGFPPTHRARRASERPRHSRFKSYLRSHPVSQQLLFLHLSAPMTLREALLSSLSTLPGTRDFFIHVLVSSPRKHSGLFPYAHPRPRVYLQDVLILLSEQASPDSPRILVTAVEVSIYNIPSTSCGILYVSKVDSTGQGASPSPTSTLVKSLLSYYANPETRPIAVNTLWIQLFARAQGQYLFPNSADYPGKRPLSDVKLCAWWKRVFTEVAERVGSTWSAAAGEAAKGKGTSQRDGIMKLYYLIPGYSELEAVHSLNISSSTRSKPSATSSSSDTHIIPWIYGHPYVQDDVPLPCPRASGGKGKSNLGHYIPSFDDDPKSRFLDELAHTFGGDKLRSPKRKKPKTTIHRKPNSKASSSNGSKPVSQSHSQPPSVHSAVELTVTATLRPPRDGDDHSDHEEEEEKETQEGELGKVSPDEFWERMSFRQECVTGAITGFFALGISCKSSECEDPVNTVDSTQNQEVDIEGEDGVATSFINADSANINISINHDGNTKSPPAPTPAADVNMSATMSATHSPPLNPLAPQPGQVAPRLLRRVVSSLMTGHEFSTRERSIRATSVLEESIKGLCENIAEIPVTTNPNLSSTTHLIFGSRSSASENPTGIVGNGNDHGHDGSGSAGTAHSVTLDQDATGPEIKDHTLESPPRTPPSSTAKKLLSSEINGPNPFGEPEASLETYRSYIYGTVAVKNPSLPPKKDGEGGATGIGDAKPVTILAVRKKKRKVE